jgi:hypothetical protein
MRNSDGGEFGACLWALNSTGIRYWRLKTTTSKGFQAIAGCPRRKKAIEAGAQVRPACSYSSGNPSQ